MVKSREEPIAVAHFSLRKVGHYGPVFLRKLATRTWGYGAGLRTDQGNHPATSVGRLNTASPKKI
ncbi:MAG: hypothetical protein LBT86_01000 [Deltaproteobacteria bacterium]|nr:hypothetical protein [Deltaproteobacteria bacterium]